MHARGRHAWLAVFFEKRPLERPLPAYDAVLLLTQTGRSLN